MADEWLTTSNFLVLCGVPDERALEDWAVRARAHGLLVTEVREPDLGGELTSIALQPGATARRLCSSLPLMLRDVPLAVAV